MIERIVTQTFPPNLYDVLLRHKRDILNSINCVQIATIEKYDNVTNSASVKINVQRKLVNGDIADYPILGDCPVVILSGGESSISFPVEKGDECIVFFNDKSIDNWYISGQTLPPDDIRSHSISDGIVLVGVRSLRNATYSPKDSICIDGGSKKIAIKNDNYDLKTLIGSLITNINSLVDILTNMNTNIALITVASFGSPPVNAATFTGYLTNLATYKANISTIKTSIDNLLDEGIT